MSMSISTSSGHRSGHDGMSIVSTSEHHSGHDAMSISSDHPPLPTSGEPTLRDLDTRIYHLDSKVNGLDSKVNGLDTRLTGLHNILDDRDCQQRRREEEHREFEAWVRRRDGEHREFEAEVRRRDDEHREFETEVRSELTRLSDRLERVLNLLEQRSPN